MQALGGPGGPPSAPAGLPLLKVGDRTLGGSGGSHGALAGLHLLEVGDRLLLVAGRCLLFSCLCLLASTCFPFISFLMAGICLLSPFLRGCHLSSFLRVLAFLSFVSFSISSFPSSFFSSLLPLLLLCPLLLSFLLVFFSCSCSLFVDCFHCPWTPQGGAPNVLGAL